MMNRRERELAQTHTSLIHQRLRENSGRDENQRFASLLSASCTLKQRSEVRDISQHRYFFHLGQIFVFKHATQYYRLAVPTNT